VTTARHASAQVPRVSVLMSARNVEAYVDAAVQSLLDQTFSNFELLIADDASTDSTWSRLEQWALRDSRIRLFRNKHPLTPPGSLNRLIPEVRGEYLAIMDADDIAVPWRLQVQVTVLDAGEVDLCAGAYIEFPVAHPMLLGCGGLEGDELKASLLFECSILQPTVMLRVAALASDRYHPEMVPAADYDFFVRLAPRLQMRVLPEVLLLKRVHGGQISQARARAQEEAAMRVRRMALSQLGLEVTDRELWLHSQIWLPKVPESWSDILETERWLSRLADRIGKLPAIRRHLFHRWYRYCLRSSRHGLKVHGLFRRSRLYRLWPASLGERCAIFVLCLLRIPYQSRMYRLVSSIRPPARRLREDIRKLPAPLRDLVQCRRP
jgi:hypothetical protein